MQALMSSLSIQYFNFSIPREFISKTIGKEIRVDLTERFVSTMPQDKWIANYYLGKRSAQSGLETLILSISNVLYFCHYVLLLKLTVLIL